MFKGVFTGVLCLFSLPAMAILCPDSGTIDVKTKTGTKQVELSGCSSLEMWTNNEDSAIIEGCEFIIHQVKCKNFEGHIIVNDSLANYPLNCHYYGRTGNGDDGFADREKAQICAKEAMRMLKSGEVTAWEQGATFKSLPILRSGAQEGGNTGQDN